MVRESPASGIAVANRRVYPIGPVIEGYSVDEAASVLGVPKGRFVTGHSSGGWTSLWLQITYADFFGGCWATAPYDGVSTWASSLLGVMQDLATRSTHGKPGGLTRKRRKVQ